MHVSGDQSPWNVSAVDFDYSNLYYTTDSGGAA